MDVGGQETDGGALPRWGRGSVSHSQICPNRIEHEGMIPLVQRLGNGLLLSAHFKVATKLLQVTSGHIRCNMPCPAPRQLTTKTD